VQEARSLRDFRHNFRHDKNVLIPFVYTEYCSADVLVLRPPSLPPSLLWGRTRTLPSDGSHANAAKVSTLSPLSTSTAYSLPSPLGRACF
jgi:hypothetical protein